MSLVDRVEVVSVGAARSTQFVALLLLAVCGALVGGCAADDVGHGPGRARRVVQSEVGVPLPIPTPAERAILSSARTVLPGYFTQKGASLLKLGGVHADTLSVRLRPVDFNKRIRPKRFDPKLAIFPQLPPWKSPVSLGHVEVDVVTPEGARVGEIAVEKRGGKWVPVWGGYDYGLDTEVASKRTSAERKMVGELGGSVDETASVGLWLLGRRGSREAGVVPWRPGFSYSRETPREGQVYSGEELASWFESFE